MSEKKGTIGKKDLELLRLDIIQIESEILRKTQTKIIDTI